jgi:hypothetical protein
LTAGDFKDPASYRTFDAGAAVGMKPNVGTVFDGRHLYFVPFEGSLMVRYDSDGSFDERDSWSATDGRYLYAAPWRSAGESGHMSGRILRYDTVDSGSFSLRYCDYGHNGGLGAAVPGPSFIINTCDGPFSVSAHQVLDPGWHHLAGTYDGECVKLYIDGSLIAERAAWGTLQQSTADIAIGHIDGGNATFRGEIREVRVDDVARNDDWIQSRHQDLQPPTPGLHSGTEKSNEI